jgi:hypothetical protein
MTKNMRPKLESQSTFDTGQLMVCVVDAAGARNPRASVISAAIGKRTMRNTGVPHWQKSQMKKNKLTLGFGPLGARDAATPSGP